MRRIIFAVGRIIIILTLAWLFVASTFHFGVFSKPQKEWQTISHPQYGFSVEYPPEWVARIYGEAGDRGAEEVKLRIYRSIWGPPEIAIHYQETSKPSLEDVVAWGDLLIAEANHYLTDHGETIYVDSSLQEDIIDGQTVIRRIYKREGIMNEDVYIARSGDMIIITLHSQEDNFENYIQEFERIVESFTPIN